MTLTCRKCGEQNSDEKKMCGLCGERLAESADAPPQVEPPPSAPCPAVTMAPRRPTPRPPLPEREPNYAEFFPRLVATIVDLLALSVIVQILSEFGVGGGFMGGWGLDDIGISSLVWLFCVGVYKVAMESSTYQATLGKMVMGLKVTDLHGERITFRAAGLRFVVLYGAHLVVAILSLVKSMDVFSLVILAYVLWIIIVIANAGNSQGPHDAVADTLVVKK